MKRLGHTAKIVVVHGTDDTTCPFAEAKELVALMKVAKFDVEPVFISKSNLDGKVFTSSGHPLGQRTEIVFKVAEKYLRPDSSLFLNRKTSTDFYRRETIRYPTTNGSFEISYDNGFPIGKFVPQKPH